MKLLFKFLLISLITCVAPQTGVSQNTLDLLGLDNTTPSPVAFSLRKLSST